MNVFNFTGNLGGAPEIRTVGDNTVANFSVAASAGYGSNKKPVWVDCALWGERRISGLRDFLVKGQQVGISGELSYREHDGKRYWQVRVNELTLLGSKLERGGESGGFREEPAKSAQQSEAFGDDDIPF